MYFLNSVCIIVKKNTRICIQERVHMCLGSTTNYYQNTYMLSIYRPKLMVFNATDILHPVSSQILVNTYLLLIVKPAYWISLIF